MNLYRRTLRCGQVALVLAAAAGVSGCSALGIVANGAANRIVKPAYAGLAGKSLGIMVAADKGIQLEHTMIQVDLAQYVESNLKKTKANNAEELKGTTFPPEGSPMATYAFQQNYPEYAWQPPTKVAPLLKVDRVIHIEVDAFTLHADNVQELFRGELTGRFRVIEVMGNAGKEVYSERITAGYPTASGASGGVGSLALSNAETYRRTLEAFAAEVSKRLVSHPEAQ